MTAEPMPGPWTDAHCHLADPRLAPHLDQVIARSRDAGVVSWVQGGVGPGDWERQRALRARFGDRIRLVFGLHPWWVADASDAQVDDGLLALQAQLNHASAIGELGLDKHPRRNKSDGGFARQQRALACQLDLAGRVAKPLVLHVVRAHDLVLHQLEQRAPFPCGGVVHAFTGTAQQALRYTELGFHISLGGALAANPGRARELACVPVQFVVIETDAPDQAPRAWQVDHNEPAFLPRIAQALAPVWGISAHELLDRAHVSLETLFSS